MFFQGKIAIIFVKKKQRTNENIIFFSHSISHKLIGTTELQQKSKLTNNDDCHVCVCVCVSDDNGDYLENSFHFLVKIMMCTKDDQQFNE